jgi:polyhydroxyalkanoate synthesis regulator phasin
MEMTKEQRKAEPPWETLDKMLSAEEFNRLDTDMSDAEVKAVQNRMSKTGSTLYSGIDPTQLPKILKAIKQIPSKLRNEKRIRLDETKVPEEYRSAAQGANEWMDSFDDARDAKKFDLVHFLDRLKFRSIRAIHEQRGQLRKDLMKYGKNGYKAVQYIDAEQASSGLADRMYYEMRSEAFRDVPSHLTTAIDAVDLVNRLTDIYGYKTGKEFIAPKGMSAANTAAVKTLLNHYMKMTPEERVTAERASKTMSDHVKKWVDEMVEVGLVAADEGEVLKSHKYRKIKTLTVQDLYDKKFDKGLMLGDKLIRSTDSGIDFLAKDPITLLETDSRILYKETANRMFRRIQNQRTKNALKEFDSEYLENPFVRFRENDVKDNQRAIPEGWIRDYYFKEGKLRTYYLEPDFALQLLGSGPHMSFELSRVLRNVFGVNLTRALTVSTSAAWATTRGLTMDIAHTFFSARRFKEVKGKNPWEDTVNYEPMDTGYERIYSRMAPKFLGQIGTDMKEVFSDVIHRGPITGAYERSGGVIPFLSMREQHYLGKGSAPPSGYNRTMDALSFWGQSMEMWNRVAVMHRMMKTLAAERRLTIDEAYKNHDLVMEATNVAVERLPYRQGGWLPKELDKIIGPFISAGYNATRTFGRAATENPVDFAARLSNLAIPTVALTIGSAMFAEEIDRDIPESYHVGSIVIPLPFDTFSFLDENGDKRYSLLRIPVDPNVAAFYNVFRLSTRKALFEAGMIDREPSYEAIVDSITRSLPVDSPMGPTVSAWMAYFGNVDTWRNNKIVDEPVGFPRSNVEGMDRPERYGQISKDIANATGMSAPRLEAAARNFGFPNNEYAWLFGRAYDKSMSDLDPKLKEEHWAQSLAKVPGLKNLFAVTVPRSYRRENRNEMVEDETFNRMIRNNNVSATAKAFYWKGVGSELEIENYIDSFEEAHIRESLNKQKDFIEKVKPLPHRDTWVYGFHKSPEYKAEDYYKIWKVENKQEERAALDNELSYLLDAGYVSKESQGRFWQKFDDLVVGNK